MKTRVFLILFLLLASLVWVLWPSSKRQKRVSKAPGTCYFLDSPSTVGSYIQMIHSISDASPNPLEEELIRAYEQLCKKEYYGNVTLSEQVTVQRIASKYAAFNGPYAYLVVGFKLAEKFLKAYRNIQEKSKSGNISLYMKKKPGDADVLEMISVAGGLLSTAHKHGLFKRTSISEAFIAVSLLLYRWMGLLQLTPEEASEYMPAAFFRTALGYMVEQASGLSYLRRMSLLRILEITQSNYPAGRMRLLLLVLSGHLRMAYDYWSIE